MSVERLYLARFLTRARSLRADDLLELGREGKVLALESFFARNDVVRVLNELPEVKILLDSGAYTFAYTVKDQDTSSIQRYLDSYIDFILKYKDRLLGYVNLDDIHDVEISWKNQKYMEERGVCPIPVYHFGEDFKWLEKYVNEYDYVGVGGIARGVSERSDRALFDKIFNYVEKKNIPVKLHAFGITRFNFLIRYSWYSVDSTTWLKAANYGKVFLPRYDAIKQRFNYLCTPFAVSVSDISEVKDETSNTHYRLVYSPQVVERIEEYFAMIGIDSEKLKTQQIERLKANVYYYEGLQKEEAMHRPPKSRDDGMFF